jgi:hypothetical protein
MQWKLMLILTSGRVDLGILAMQCRNRATIRIAKMSTIIMSDSYL